jgi:aminoglycoside phosphotransferase (APT) family kinase protein
MMQKATFRLQPTDSVRMSGGKPDAELTISAELVRHLLQTQHPDLADLPLRTFASGWDNQLFTLGDQMIVRIPRRELAAALVINEQTWLAELATRLPLPVPAPLRIGEPAGDYPWHWSIVPAFTGEPADLASPTAAQASVWAEFLKALHQPAPDNAPENDFRGVPLGDRQPAMQVRIDRLRRVSDEYTSHVEQLWETALAASKANHNCWLHGDLHAQNVLIDHQAFSAVIDWGDITSGDTATDLASIWALFPDQSARQEVLALYQPDQATLDRAFGWAVMFGVILLDSGLINSPRHAAMGRDMLRRVATDTTATKP